MFPCVGFPSEHDGRRPKSKCHLPWFWQGLWLRQPQVFLGENDVLRSWWCRRAVDWSIPFWTGLESTSWWRTLGNHSNAQWGSAGLRDRPTLVSPFREQTLRCLRSTDAALCGWCQNGNSADTKHEPSQLSYCCMGPVTEMGLLNRLSFSLDGSGTPIPVFKFNQCSPSLCSVHWSCK